MPWHTATITTNSPRSLQPTEGEYIRCLINAEKLFSNLSLPWFIAFSTALMYHRSNTFVSHDIDTGVFSHDLAKVNLTDAQFRATFREHGFPVFTHYGQQEHGRGWLLICNNSRIHFDIFVFYPSDPKKGEKFTWWFGTHHESCKHMRYGKCRWGFSDFKLDTFEMHGKNFRIVPKPFLVEHYGPQWTVPKVYNQVESVKYLYNLVQE
jgi:hypothetical protein